jgi:hypothetical protein
MENHGNVYLGPITVQCILLKPTWTSGDIGRLIYVISEDKFYNGKATEWEEMGSGSGGGIETVETLPTWSSSYIGKIVYVTTEDKFYTGKATEWEEMGSGGGGVVGNILYGSSATPPDPTDLDNGTIYIQTVGGGT